METCKVKKKIYFITIIKQRQTEFSKILINEMRFTSYALPIIQWKPTSADFSNIAFIFYIFYLLKAITVIHQAET